MKGSMIVTAVVILACLLLIDVSESKPGKAGMILRVFLNMIKRHQRNLVYLFVSSWLAIHCGSC